MDWIPLLGFTAGATTVVSFIPQVIQVWRTRRVRDLSLGTFTMLVTGALLWTTYGIMLGDVPIIVTNSSVAVLLGAILAAKFRFGADTPVDPPAPSIVDPAA